MKDDIAPLDERPSIVVGAHSPDFALPLSDSRGEASPEPSHTETTALSATERTIMTKPTEETTQLVDLARPTLLSELDWCAMRAHESTIAANAPWMKRDDVQTLAYKTVQAEKLIEKYRAQHPDASGIEALGECSKLAPDLFNDVTSGRPATIPTTPVTLSAATATKMEREIAEYIEAHPDASHMQAVNDLLLADPSRWGVA